MNPIYSIPPFIVSLSMVTMGAIFLLRNPGVKLHRLFACCAGSLGLWSFGYGLMYATANPIKGLFYARLGYLGVVFIPTFFLHFVLEFLGLKRTNILVLVYSLSLFFLIISRFDMFLVKVHTFFWGFYPIAGPAYIYFVAFFYACCGACVYFLLEVYWKLKKAGNLGLKLNQVKYVLLAFFIASLSLSDYLPNYYVEVYPFAYLVAFGWLVFIAYATFRHQLMDITIVIRKTLLYSFVSGITAAAYAGIVTLLARLVESNPSSVILLPYDIFKLFGSNLKLSFAYSCIATAVFSVWIGVFVLRKDPRKKINILWCLVCLAVADWSFGQGMLVRSADFAEAYFWTRWFHHTGAILIPALFFHFVTSVMELKMPRSMVFHYFGAAMLLVMDVSGKLMTVTPSPPFNYFARPLPDYWLFVGFFFGSVVYAHGLMLWKIRQTHGREKSQLLYLFLGTAIGFCGGSTTFFPAYDIPIFPFGAFAVPIYIVMVVYAIFKHQLMDIRIVIRKTLVYSLVSAALAAVYVGTITLLAHLLGSRHGSVSAFSSALAAIFITLLFNPLRNRLQLFIDGKFARSRIVGGEQLVRFSTEVTGHENLEKIASSVGRILEEAVHPDLWALYLRAADDKEFIKIASTHAESLPDKMPLANIWSNHLLTSADEHIEQDGIAEAVPLMGGRNLLGYLLLGKKRSEEAYTEEDLVLLRLVTNQAAVAFERPKMARQISGAFVHEIKMPLANISLPAELSFMDLTDIETGKKSWEDLLPKLKCRMKFIMEQATLAGQRVEAVREVSDSVDCDQGPADLAEIIRSSLNEIEPMIRQAKVQVKFDCPKVMPFVPGKSGQLGIVLTNLFKNAAEAMAESLQPRHLEISVHEDSKTVTIRVTDTGPGIKPEDLPMLFQSHYTTKGTGGSGMGLFLSRRIIEAHEGTISVSSGPGQKTEFTIRFPVRKIKQ